MDILGGGMGAPDAGVLKTVDDEMAPIGIRFNYISVLNRPRVPDAIQDAINEAIESTLRSLSLSGWQSLLKEPEQRRPMALCGALIKDRCRHRTSSDVIP